MAAVDTKKQRHRQFQISSVRYDPGNSSYKGQRRIQKQQSVRVQKATIAANFNVSSKLRTKKRQPQLQKAKDDPKATSATKGKDGYKR